jgi:hypothetical protein
MMFHVDTAGLVVIFLALGVAIPGVISDVATVSMKRRINQGLSEGSRLTWWSRNYAEVNRMYRESYPESRLPDIAQYCGYVAGAFFAALVLSAFIFR